jgi:purine-binding chemotaxis protein CheW
MDFLEIRKKARERAAARGAGERPAGDAASPGDPAAAPPLVGRGPAEAEPAPAADPVVTEADVLEGELAARLQGHPAPEEGFTTWRPGSGPAPRPPAQPAPEPRREDFTVLARTAASTVAPARAPAPAPPPPPTPPAGAPTLAARGPLDDFFYRPDEEAPEIPAIGGPAGPDAAGDADTAVREEYLTFVLGREEYAVAIERVREVVKAPLVTEVPRAPAHILGVVTVRGDVVAVFDPRRRLGLPGAPPTGGAGRIVIVDGGEGPCGLLVDAVASVVRLPPGAIEPCPQGIGGARAECLSGIGRDGERLFTVLDLGALLRRAPAGPARRGEEGDRRAGP